MPNNNNFGKTRDTAILEFVWRWKIATTSAIATRFFANTSPIVAYNRLRELKKAGLLELQPMTVLQRTFVWTLTKKGFECIVCRLPRLHEEGFRSECPEHDLLAAACQLGPWLGSQPFDVEMFSERELRSVEPEYFPSWVPKTTIRRSDGYWKVIYLGEPCIIALEVERNKKSGSRYDVIAAFYRDNPSIFRVIWLVATKYVAESIQAIFKTEVGEQSHKHNFILIDDFETSGWMAPICLGLEQGRTIAFVLRHECVPSILCPCTRMDEIHLNTNLRSGISSASVFRITTENPNCIGYSPISPSVSISNSLNPNCKGVLI